MGLVHLSLDLRVSSRSLPNGSTALVFFVMISIVLEVRDYRLLEQLHAG